MSTNWVVTTAAERVALDDAKRGETTFTVTNPAARADRAVFQVVPGDGADPAWFTVDQPQRQVAASGSASFLLAVQVPDGAAPGTYEVRGRVYSASEAPEESSVLSNRIVFDVAAPPAPEKRRIPMWILLVAAALVVITVVTVTLVLTLGGGEAQQARPQPSAAPSGPVTVPKLLDLNEANAGFALRDAHLVPGVIKHRIDTVHTGNVVESSPAVGATVESGSEVALVIAVKLGAPTAKTADKATLSIAQNGRLEWDQAEPYVTRWQVTYSPYMCFQSVMCTYIGMATIRVDTRSAAPPLRPASAAFQGQYSGYVLSTDATFQWTVAPVDDFGNVGPASAPLTGRMVA
ncbi:PASTA domain-containing protein [Dactylosporangium matsuzakiense]|uniref:PASTA domain-containing protein n=1 Tax=Dactylosporangium matsuzakiense TaxID=53360 RepID=A0A9W6NPR8_9ACTN|nr:PASTA domain-containing protein [Dactylosporangium matsuzakiense]UWZ41007.1 PASTA domain-containing protein [Dactylosporangium matsuzakiense]GLL04784.1 hypothetical protein GCM10017581_065310 [Dactylosporangium matsuzakiense]